MRPRAPVVGGAALVACAASALLAAADALARRVELVPVTEVWIRRLVENQLIRPLWPLARSRFAGWILLALLALGIAAWRFSARARPFARAAGIAAAIAIAVPAAVGLSLGAYLLAPRVALPAHLAALAVFAVAIASGRGRRPTLRAGALALMALDVGLLIVTWSLHVRAAAARTRPADRFSPARAYDALTVGDALVYTDQEHAWIVRAPEDAHPAPPEPIALGVFGMPERLIRSAEPDTFYLAISAGGALRVALTPAPVLTRFRAEGAQHAAWLAEDPGRRLFVLNEWDGHVAAFPLVAPGPSAPLGPAAPPSAPAPPVLSTLFPAPWPVPNFYVDAPARRGYATSALLDGSLVVIDLDTLSVIDRRPDLFLYATVSDPDQATLWAVRALPGELLALDRATLTVRRRIPLAPGTRALVLDRARRQLFVSTYPFGDLFRVDAATGEVLEVGSCGWRCRSLALDPARRVLWAASHEGIFRIAIDRPLN